MGIKSVNAALAVGVMVFGASITLLVSGIYQTTAFGSPDCVVSPNPAAKISHSNSTKCVSGTIGCSCIVGGTCKPDLACTDAGVCAQRKFVKPVFAALLANIGEMILLVPFLSSRWWDRRQRQGRTTRTAPSSTSNFRYSQEQGLLDAGPGGAASTLSPFDSPGNLQLIPKNSPSFWNFALLALFDTSTSLFFAFSLKFLLPSIVSMLTGTLIVFNGVFTFVVFRRHQTTQQWAGIGVVAIGLVIVGLSSYLQDEADDNSNPGNTLIGLCMVLLGSSVNSLQTVIEEKLLKGGRRQEDKALSPQLILGMEGVFGALYMCAIVFPSANALPGSDCGRLEDLSDTLAMLGNAHSSLLPWMMCLVSVIAGANLTGQLLSKRLSAVHRSLVNVGGRGAVVWIVGLLIGAASSQTKGEKWSKYSPIEVLGFLFVCGGAALHSASDSKKKNSATCIRQRRHSLAAPADI